MKFATALLARFGWASKENTPDAFDARLRKIERREAAHAARQSLFKIQQTLRAA